jgi:hypothetical protein
LRTFHRREERASGAVPAALPGHGAIGRR